MATPRTLDYTGFVSATDPRTFPTNDIRSLEAQGGNPNAMVGQGQDQSVDVGNAILEKLRQFQKYGRSQEVSGQLEQINRGLNTPQNLIGASPAIQEGARAASMRAVQPTIGGARDLIAEAKSLMGEYQQTEEKNQARAANLISMAISTGSTGLEELLRSSPDIFKKAGYDTKSFEAVLKGLKTKEARDSQTNLTESERSEAEIKNTDAKLNASRAGGQFVDGNVYNQLKRTSAMTPKDFDARYSNLLSPDDKKKYGMTTATGGDMAMATTANKIQTIASLADDKYLTSAVGPNPAGRVSLTSFITGGKSNFIGGIEQIRSQLDLNALIQAKEQGATFGALSDNELQMLASAASRIGTWAIKNSSGQVTGYKIGEKDFRKELDKINNFAKLDYILKGGNPSDVGALVQTDGTIWSQNTDGSYTQLR